VGGSIVSVAEAVCPPELVVITAFAPVVTGWVRIVNVAVLDPYGTITKGGTDAAATPH